MKTLRYRFIFLIFLWTVQKVLSESTALQTRVWKNCHINYVNYKILGFS